ncbi:hypothetical protein WJX72_000950 [[Myrmecia] bisecta]|uniref:RRM domain-containing protein n=1 Tax=[Myrmecia] bisecta TaxID=41462 RepID=A0AAW1PB66_9CHLO
MSSRICVKGLPKHVGEQRLREHFSEKGEVTDAKVIRSKDGLSRQFGFVGFRTNEQAAAAIKYFNRTFMDTSRIIVEFAEPHGSGTLARPWSKYSEGSTANKKVKQKNGEVVDEPKADRKKRSKAKPADPAEEDPKLAEFLQLMQPRRAGTIWSNDDTTPAGSRPAARAANGKQPKAKAASRDPKDAAADGDADGDAGEEDDLYEDLTVNTQLREDGDGEDGTEDADGGEGDGAAAPKDAAVMDEGVSDLDYLRSRMKVRLSEEAEEPELREANQAERSEDEPASDADEDMSGEAGSEASIEETGRLFVRNLPFLATEADLSELFGEYGELAEVHLVLDKATRKSRGIAYVQYMEPADASAAHAALDGSIFQGRLVHIIPARKQPAAPDREDNEHDKAGDDGFKDKREAERRANAGNRSAWNTLFMRPDTVAEAVAAHYNITKSELLDRDAADLPVRMALGETHVIGLTKKALGDAGVSVEALEEAAGASGKASATKAIARSTTALLVKNLPYSATAGELQELFGKCGELTRLVLPPTRTLAVVEYREAGEARRAFKSLAYKRFHHVPIYLEWAPQGIFRADAPLAEPADAGKKPLAEDAAGDGGEVVDPALITGVAEVDDEAAESTTIYVKNLAFATDDKQLAKHFDTAVSATGGVMRNAKVQRKKGPDGKMLSLGFGFVECSSEASAKLVIKQLQGSLLDGHKLMLQLSMRKATAAAPEDSAAKAKAKAANKAGAAATTKLIVRNVAFEATRKDIAALFGPFGLIKSCRLPRKFDGTHRGFAFVDFATKQEARNAADAVAGTHLYGRRLVVEWANPDESLDELRLKTAAKFHEDEEDVAAPAAKRQKQAV